MTAQEAKENGFVTEVKANTVIDRQTAALISACGCPRAKFPKTTTENGGNDLERIIEALELPIDATIEQILETIATLKGEETPEKAIKNALKIGSIKAFEQNEFLTIAKTSPRTFAQLMRKRKEQTKIESNSKIESILSTGIREKRFIATAKSAWKTLFELDFVAANMALQQIEPLQKIDYTRSHPGGSESRANWTLDDYRKKDPKALKNDPELYNKLIEKEQSK